MKKIDLIITCEDCNIVKHHRNIKEDDIDKHIHSFQANHQECNPKFLSYITISSIPLTETGTSPKTKAA